MDIRNLTTFIQVAELGNFTKAAGQLGYSQSAVTVQIRQLEQELGTLLFERIGRHVRLTEEGEALVERAVAVLRAVQEAENVGKVGRQGGKAAYRHGGISADQRPSAGFCGIWPKMS